MERQNAFPDVELCCLGVSGPLGSQGQKVLSKVKSDELNSTSTPVLHLFLFYGARPCTELSTEPWECCRTKGLVSTRTKLPRRQTIPAITLAVSTSDGNKEGCVQGGEMWGAGKQRARHGRPP